jgi:hypothetical protein
MSTNASSLTYLLNVAEICVEQLQPKLGKGTEAFAVYATDMCAFLSALATILPPREWMEAQQTILSATHSQATGNAIH